MSQKKLNHSSFEDGNLRLFVFLLLIFFCFLSTFVSTTLHFSDQKLTNTGKTRGSLLQRLLLLLKESPQWASLKFKYRHSWVDKRWLSLALPSAWEVQWPEESAGQGKPHQLEITYKAVWIPPQSLPAGKVQMLTWVWNGATLKTLNTWLSHSFRGVHTKGRRLVPEVCLWCLDLLLMNWSQWDKKKKKEETLWGITKLRVVRMGPTTARVYLPGTGCEPCLSQTTGFSSSVLQKPLTEYTCCCNRKNIISEHWMYTLGTFSWKEEKSSFLGNRSRALSSAWKIPLLAEYLEPSPLR